jgi:hypothetical protein
MIRYLKLFLLISLITTARSWSSNNSIYFPLQVGNTWNYFWGYELPECCHLDSSHQCFFECILEGAETIHKIEDSFIRNGKTYYIYIIREPLLGNIRILKSDTLTLINNCIYRYTGTEHRLWLNFNSPESLYTFKAQPEDTFSVEYFNRTFGAFPIHSALFNVKSSLTNDSLFVLNKKVSGQFYKIDYTKADTNGACWIENYWPGIGLVYSSYPNNSSYIVLQSAIINGDSVKVSTKRHRFQPEFVMKPNSSDNRIFDIRGNVVPFSNSLSRYGSAPVGIYISKSGRKMIPLCNVK